jgi:type I restriction enzyme S subunit
MNAELLLAHFDRISDAPDAVPSLRRFILDLAVRGKLMEQKAGDEPASELLKQIQTELARLVKKGIIKRQEAIPPMEVEERPFDLPANWCWARLGRICSKTGSGSTPRGGKEVYQKHGVPFLRSQNVYNDGLRLDDVAYINLETHSKMSGTAVEPNDLLLNITGGSIGRCCIVSSEFCPANVSQHVAIIRVVIDGTQSYLHQLVLSPYFQSLVMSEQTGAGRGGLPKNRMDMIPVALPPMDEQQRIVARVQELMALCDRLEEAQLERETRRDQITASTHHHLNNAADAEKTRNHAQFFIGHLPHLTTRPDQIKQLRQTILNVAVRGKLVSQYTAEEPTIEMLRRIALPSATAERRKRDSTRLWDELEGNSPNLSQIPGTWEWAKTEDICDLIVDCPHSTPVFTPSGVACVDTNSFKGGSILKNKLRYVSEESFIERTRRTTPVPGDVIFAREGSVGESVIVPVGMQCCLGQRVMLFRLKKEILPEYFQLALSEESSLERLLVLHKGIGAKHVNVADMRKAIVPLPPTAEQHRIVAKVDELMALCDQLEARLTIAQTEASRLLESVLYNALQASA